MAGPIDFPDSNAALTAPPGCEDRVQTLHVRRADGMLVSCWQLGEDELAEIARTGVVWLSVWGPHTQPPVLVTAFRDQVILPGDPVCGECKGSGQSEDGALNCPVCQGTGRAKA